MAARFPLVRCSQIIAMPYVIIGVILIFPDFEVQILEFVHERRKNGQPVTSEAISNNAKEVAKVLNIPNQEFKASRGWVDRFMKRVGLSLRRRTTICQKLPVHSEEKLQSTSFSSSIRSIR